MAKKIKMTTRSRKTEAFINYKYNDDFYGYDLYERETSFITEKRYYTDDRDVMEEREYNPINADGIMFGSELEEWEKW